MQLSYVQQRKNNDTDDLPQVNQTNLDAGLVANLVTVNATSSVGATAAEVEADFEIDRESSLIVGEPRCGIIAGLLQEIEVICWCLYFKSDSNRRMYRHGHLRTLYSCFATLQPFSTLRIRRTRDRKPCLLWRPWMSHSQVRSPSAALNYPSKTVSVKTGTAGGASAHGNITTGDTITSTFEVKNTGHTCLAVTSIVDEKAGQVECPYVVGMAGEERWLVAFRTFDLGCVGGKDCVGLQGFVFFVVLSFIV